MKKFSVIFVAMLIALMLFVGCENKPKERAATKDDAEVVTALVLSSVGYTLRQDDIPGVSRDTNGDTITATFKNAEVKDSEDNVVVVLYGSVQIKGSTDSGSMTIDLKSGTQYKGKGHTLYGQSTGGNTGEIFLDGVKLTDLDKVKID